MRNNSLKFIKTFFLLSVLCYMQFANAQAPQKMSYQAVIRNASSVLVTSAPVGMRISILQGSASGSSVYTETQSVITNANGLVSLEIGTGSVVFGNFATINWGNGPYFIKTETDPTGGTTYTITGTSQLTSVPYALFSAGSANGETSGTAVGDMKYWNGTAWVLIPVGTPGQFLQLNASNVPTWNGGTFATVTTAPIANQTYYNPFQSGSLSITNLGITSSGGSPVTAIGLCWSTTPNPTIADANSLAVGNYIVGTYPSYVATVVPNTLYYVRAFAINSAGTAYGNQITFNTFNPVVPTVTTTAATAITGGVASTGGNVTNDGGAFVNEKGVCWSTSPSPTIADSKSVGGNNTGTYTNIANGLVPSTTYYLRAYATNVVGTGYGNQISFTTSATLSIGSYYQGGIIGYFLQSGDPGYSPTIQHGIIFSQNDIGSGVLWGCVGTLVSGANGTLIGDGVQNTVDIITGCTTLGIAAELCYNLTLNSYSDWFLPGKIGRAHV